MHPNVEGKVAVVTGGSRGIGFSIAATLVENGAKVLLGARHDDEVREAVNALNQSNRDGSALGLAVDVRDYRQVERFMSHAEKQFGGIDILVNNAGIGTFGAVDELSPEQWDAVIQTNLNGPFYCIRAAVPGMKRRGGGYIINISSLAGKNAFAGGAAYNASKFGLNALSEAAMLDLRHANIRISYIMPGSVETSFGRLGRATGKSSGARWKIEPTDIAQVVVDLLKSDSRIMLSRVEMRPSKPPKS